MSYKQKIELEGKSIVQQLLIDLCRSATLRRRCKAMAPLESKVGKDVVHDYVPAQGLMVLSPSLEGAAARLKLCEGIVQYMSDWTVKTRDEHCHTLPKLFRRRNRSRQRRAMLFA